MNIQIEKKSFSESISLGYCSNKTTEDFWVGRKFPNLSKLALLLMNIPSSSAYIERQFSVSGSICSQRRGNMSSEQIINRVVIKTNMNIIVELNKN